MTLNVQKDLNNQLALIQMRIDGKTLVEIANTLGISLSTASRWNRLFKSDILSVQNKQVENLRNKIIDRYNSYFDFLDSQLERLKTEIGLHKEIAMTYPDLIDYTIKILEAQNRINIFRKFSYKPPPLIFPRKLKTLRRMKPPTIMKKVARNNFVNAESHIKKSSLT